MVGSLSAQNFLKRLARLTHTGQLVLDTTFKDELTGRSCVAMDRPTSYHWPNRGRTGAAKPHAMAFINVDEEKEQHLDQDQD